MNMQFTRIPLQAFPNVNIQILHSEGLFSHTGPVLFVLQAGGLTRAGLWTSRLLTRSEQGHTTRSQRELLLEAHAAGFAVAIINANEVFASSANQSLLKPNNTVSKFSAATGSPPEPESSSSTATATALHCVNIPSNARGRPAEAPVTDSAVMIHLTHPLVASTDPPSCPPPPFAAAVGEESTVASTGTWTSASRMANLNDQGLLSAASFVDLNEVDPYCEVSAEERVLGVWRLILPLCASRQIFVWAHHQGADCFLYPLRAFPSFCDCDCLQLSAASAADDTLAAKRARLLTNRTIATNDPSTATTTTTTSTATMTCPTADGSAFTSDVTLKGPSALIGLTRTERLRLRRPACRRRHASATAILVSRPPPVEPAIPAPVISPTPATPPIVHPTVVEESAGAGEGPTPRPPASATPYAVELQPCVGGSKDTTAPSRPSGPSEERLRAAWHRRAQRYWSQIRERVRAVVLTDAAIAANLPMRRVGWGLVSPDGTAAHAAAELPPEVQEVREWFRRNAIHYVTADAPLGTNLDLNEHQFTGISTLSAGTTEHELIPNTVTSAVLKYFKDRLSPTQSAEQASVDRSTGDSCKTAEF
uniref:Uncharacterized protein n=1 Tax=Schistocephalus solidus TaxID=70667 RepID=A0A0V0J9Z5_SCHSO